MTLKLTDVINFGREFIGARATYLLHFSVDKLPFFIVQVKATDKILSSLI